LAAWEQRRQYTSATEYTRSTQGDIYHGNALGQQTPPARIHQNEKAKQYELRRNNMQDASKNDAEGGGQTDRSNPIFAKRRQLGALLSKQIASTVVIPHWGARSNKCSTKRRPTPPKITALKTVSHGAARLLKMQKHRRTTDARQAAKNGYFSGGGISISVLEI
jgi:hypothetical protein